MFDQLTTIDLFVFVLMLLVMPVSGIVVALRRRNTEGYFLAGRSVRWWMVAGSIFGTNISSFHLIGMLGVGYSIGFMQAHYEIVFPAILLICYVFLASYRHLGIFTLSQYLEMRFNETARLTYSVLLVLIILVQLVGAFYVGSITLQWLFSGATLQLSYFAGLVLIGAITCSYTIWGGLDSIVITDSIQTIMMLLAGIVVACFTFAQPEIGGFGGMLALDAAQPLAAQKMHLYLPTNHPNLPWSGVFTGLMLQHCFNFSTNQFIVQRALAASSDGDARKGIIASGFLKLCIPFFSISTGIAAFYLFKSRFGSVDFNSDNTFLKLVETVVPSGVGLTGMILAGLTAATFSSIDSMMNTASTLLSVDIYQKYLRPKAKDAQVLRFGRISIVVMVFVAIAIASITYTPDRSNNFFLRVSAQLSYFTPGIMAAFFFGMLWPRANARGAVVAMLAGPLFGVGAEWIYDIWLAKIPTIQALFGLKLNFLHRIAFSCLMSTLMILLLRTRRGAPSERSGLLQFEQPIATVTLFKKVGLFLAIQFIFIAIIHFKGIPARIVAIPGAIGAFLVFIPALKASSVRIWANDLLYAGLLTAASVWMYYYFA